MQKSENKIKPMYFWSDGYEEHGMFGSDLKKIREDELAADVDDKAEEFVFEPVDRALNKQSKIKKKKFKKLLKSRVQRALAYTEWKLLHIPNGYH